MVQQSVAISKNNIFTQVHANIFNLINNRSNVSDPNDSSGIRKFVYTREPLNMIDKFPFIIVHDAQYIQKLITVSGTKSAATDEIQIDIYGRDKSSDGSGDPSGRDTVATISDNIMSTLNNLTNRAVLRSNGINNLAVTSTDFDWGEHEGQPVFKRTINIRFTGLRSMA